MANRKYCSLDDVKLYLGIGQDIDDVLLNSIIERATKRIEMVTHKIFFCDVATSKFLDARENVKKHGRKLWFFDSIAEIVYIVNGSGFTIPANDYATEPRNEPPYHSLQLKSSSQYSFADWNTNYENAIEVNGFWCYSKTVPLDIELACIRLATYFYRQKDNTSDLDRPVVTAEGHTVMPIKMPADVKDLLSPYIEDVIF